MSLMTILKTKDEKSAIIRAIRMKLSPTCGRCGGSGNYSYNAMDGTRCFGCHGYGHVAPKTAAQLAETIRQATEAAEDGRLEAYRQNIRDAKQAKQATDTYFAAWKEARAARENPHHGLRDHQCTPRQVMARQMNKLMSDAHNELSLVINGYNMLGQKREGGRGSNTEIVAALETALAKLAAAEAEYLAFKE